MNANMYCDILKQSMIPTLWRLGRRAVFQHDNDPKHTSKMTTALLKKLRVKIIGGASSNGRWRSARSLTSSLTVILWGQQIYTVIQAVHSLLYIVAKCHFFSVDTCKDIIKYLQKCEGCTHSVRYCMYIYIYIYIYTYI